MDISREHRGPFRIARNLIAGDETKQIVSHEHRRQDHESGRRQNASYTSSIEPCNRNTCILRIFVEQKVRYKEPGDDEKHINTHESTGKRRAEAVIEQYQAHSNGAHTLDIRPKAVAGYRPNGGLDGFRGRTQRLVSVNCHCLRVHTAPTVRPPTEWRINDQHRRQKSSCGGNIRPLQVVKLQRARRPSTPHTPMRDGISPCTP
jgi:hypothetical protein